MDLDTVAHKAEMLAQWFWVHRPLMVAFSGGVDSTLLLAQAHFVLGAEVVAVTSVSAIHPSLETSDARRFAARLGVRQLCLDMDELSDPAFVSNGPDRCYICKHALFSRLRALADEYGIVHIAHGATVDDASDYRPGQRAAQELGILAPLAEVGLGKEEIRILSKSMGLETWERPAQACLASRIAYGLTIDRHRIDQVAAAEDELIRLGIKGGRVRHHGDTARIEVDPEYYTNILEDKVRNRLISVFKRLGFAFVTLDLEGYVPGSLNRVLNASL